MVEHRVPEAMMQHPAAGKPPGPTWLQASEWEVHGRRQRQQGSLHLERAQNQSWCMPRRVSSCETRLVWTERSARPTALHAACASGGHRHRHRRQPNPTSLV